MRESQTDGLLQVVVDIWSHAAPPPRPVIEHLTTDKVSQEVLNILKLPKSESEVSCRADPLFQAA
ncbi:hypothetical protein A264_16227 [Pseudomonas syringae pv. actinidiae ICMP 19071]|nr:hypothetical protein A264_16227 [Pseudomonas syringae pv. actinidiae ICMP 19071]